MIVLRRSDLTTRPSIVPSTIERQFDQAFGQLSRSLLEPRRTAGPAVNGTWVDGEYHLTVDLPGIPASAVSVEVTGDVLSVTVRDGQLDWTRSMRLADRLDPEQVSARHVDGRLTVRIGTHPEPTTRTVLISTGPDDGQSIDTNSIG
jgi:HSP20 family molecular chaperone IbpA